MYCTWNLKKCLWFFFASANTMIFFLITIAQITYGNTRKIAVGYLWDLQQQAQILDMWGKLFMVYCRQKLPHCESHYQNLLILLIHWGVKAHLKSHKQTNPKQTLKSLDEWHQKYYTTCLPSERTLVCCYYVLYKYFDWVSLFRPRPAQEKAVHLNILLQTKDNY